MAYSAPQRPAAVYSAMVGLVVLSVCGFVTGLRLYMPHHRTAVAETIQITTPAPTIPQAAPVAVAQAEPAPAPPRSHAKHDDTDEASAPIGDQADAAALAPVDRPATDMADATDGPVAEQAVPARAEDAQPQQNAGPAPEPDR